MSSPTFNLGAAYTFTERDTGFFTSEQISSPTIGTTVTPLLNNNADRLELIFFNNGTVDVVVWIDPSVTATLGMRIVAGGGFLVFKVRDDFTLMSRSWFGISTGAAQQISITEVFRVSAQPGGRP